MKLFVKFYKLIIFYHIKLSLLTHHEATNEVAIQGFNAGLAAEASPHKRLLE